MTLRSRIKGPMPSREDLSRALNSRRVSLQILAASHPALGENEIDALCSDITSAYGHYSYHNPNRHYGKIVSALARRKDLPYPAVFKLVKLFLMRSDLPGMKEFCQNYSTHRAWSDFLLRNANERFYKVYPERETLATLAALPLTPALAPLIERYTKAEAVLVPLALNPTTPESTLTRLAGSNRSCVADAAFRNPNTPYSAYLDTYLWAVPADVLKRILPHLSEDEIVDMMIKHENKTVLWALAYHGEVSPAQLGFMLFESQAPALASIINDLRVPRRHARFLDEATSRLSAAKENYYASEESLGEKLPQEYRSHAEAKFNEASSEIKKFETLIRAPKTRKRKTELAEIQISLRDMVLECSRVASETESLRQASQSTFEAEDGISLQPRLTAWTQVRQAEENPWMHLNSRSSTSPTSGPLRA